MITNNIALVIAGSHRKVACLNNIISRKRLTNVKNTKRVPNHCTLLNSNYAGVFWRYFPTQLQQFDSLFPIPFAFFVLCLLV